MNYRDVAERLAWTAVSSALGAVAAGMAGLDAPWVPVVVVLINALTLVVRQHVPGVPPPGAGIPGLPTAPKA